jgi:hypothetical protein
VTAGKSPRWPGSRQGKYDILLLTADPKTTILGGAIVAQRGRSTPSIAVAGGGTPSRQRQQRWEDPATTTWKRLVGLQGQGGDDDNDINTRGNDGYDTTISLAMATATRVAGDEEGDGGKSDGNDEKGGGQATATTMATKRAMAAATRVAGNKEGDGKGGGRLESWGRR